MALELELGTSFTSTPETRQEIRISDVVMMANGRMETLRDKEVTINYESSDFTILEIDGMKYPVFRKKGEKLFHSRPRYTTEEAFSLPLLAGYSGFSTFYNIQIWFDVEQLITISNVYLMFFIVGLTFLLAIERVRKRVDVLFLQQYYRAYKTIDLEKSWGPTVIRGYYIHKGWSSASLFGSAALGFLLILPLAFSEVVYEIDYIISWIAAAVVLAVVLNKWIFEDKSALEIKQMRIYGPQVVEPVFNSSTTVGYKPLGILINIKGRNKEERKEFIDNLEKKYKDKHVIGFKEVISTESVMEDTEIPFQTFLGEAYRDADFVSEKNYEITSANAAKEFLNQSIIELTDLEFVKKAIKNIPENSPINKTGKEILLIYDRLVRRYQNATAYLVQENKNRADISISDKEVIKNLTGAYQWQAANNARPPRIGAANKPDLGMVYNILAAGGVILAIFFALVWATEKGFI